MIQTSISLPKKYRLDVHLVQRRDSSVSESILPTISDIKNVRRGSKLSRVFTHIFSHRHIKRLFGANIAFAIMISTFMPVKTSFTENEVNIVSVQTLITKTEAGIQYPLDKITVNQGYKFYHPGIDFEGITGDPIRPIMPGRVESIQHSRFLYGNAIIISHGDGFSSLYAHLSKIEVKEGDEVNKNTEIGKVGSTGRSTGDHLHLEVHQNGKPINPFSILPKLEK